MTGGESTHGVAGTTLTICESEDGNSLRMSVDMATVERLVESHSIAALDLKYAGSKDGGGGAEWLCRTLRLMCSNRPGRRGYTAHVCNTWPGHRHGYR